MNHIKLFEQFKQGLLKESQSDNIMFDWLAYDNQLDNPIQGSIPESLSYDDLIKYCNDSDCSGIQEAGLFIAHVKNSDGGFTRYIATSLMPLQFDVSTFNKDFEMKNETKGVDAADLNPTAYSKASSLLGRTGMFDFKPNPGME
jgi:hypothetical protein